MPGQLARRSAGLKASPSPAHPVVTPPRGSGPGAPSVAWEASYPEKSIDPKSSKPGGFGFYLSGPPEFYAGLRTAKEALISYSVMFEKEWDFVKGGKLPGIYGGEGDYAYGCSGGRQEEKSRCFSLRLMWRERGSGEIYSYLPECDRNTDILLAVPPKSYWNDPYGFSVGRGAFSFPRLEWVTVAERVKLNDVGKENGELELWVNGESVISVKGLIYRVHAASMIQGAYFSTFVGGHTEEWESPKDRKAWFGNVSGAILD